MTIIATAGATNANSYGTLAEAESYFENHPDLETWDEATDQEEALIWATMRLDEYDFIGEIATTTQSLKWPRIDDDIFDLKWTEIEIPLRLKYAQFELALERLREVASGTSSTDSQPVSSLKIGNSVEVRYNTSGSTTDTSIDFSQLPIQVARHLRGLRLPALFA
jgi:hypothetical protein